ncbi:hypothetical protein PRZ48_003437 [Zasmidium cellare]|uniref:Dynamin GTPase n=1 Tax=Zasmidium cellare TaxID=395010 RepID=A0ABR0EV14_ZASCE|nr:hypothetical protein PRZ48_003437 [Zasmidium cellare]
MGTSTTPTASQYGLGNQRMLEKIDKLFACGVGAQVALPQIVVVGDQSSGKSSVLEGLIKKPLPRDSGLCTRFATHIIFERSATTDIHVSIKPDQKASKEHIDVCDSWGKSVEALDSDAFVEIMQEVHEVMGLSSGSDESTTRKPTFSNDVLCLKISGPDQEHLSVIDVPGIFRTTTEGLTTQADTELVRNMVTGYMDNPRSVMLAVIPANVDAATQEILEMARAADPTQDRTLGVLTKPDLVDKGAEPKVIDLLDGRSRPMKLGWHVIRNPGQSDLSDKNLDRDAREASFFRSHAPWSAVDPEKTGIDSLRVRLNEVLSSLVKKEFPKVRAEIKGEFDKLSKKLADLGPERGGSAEQMAFLTNLATQFQRLVSAARTANHGADKLFDKEPSLRILPAIYSRMNTFSSEMAAYGETYYFLTEEAKDSKKELVKDEEEGFKIRKEENIADLADMLHPQATKSGPDEKDIKGWLLEVFQMNRGFELGTFNASILATVMNKQSVNWENISLGFVSDIIVMVHRFITTALSFICKDAEICRTLTETLFEDLVGLYQKAIDNTRFLLEVERNDTPMTLNHYFNETLQKSRQEKVLSQLQNNSFDLSNYGKVVQIETAMKTHSMSNEEHTVQDIHDILESYYRVSRKTFVDNVGRQAAIHYLLNADKGPLGLFSPLFVSQLSPDQLEEIAGEAPADKRKRAQLTKDIASLKEAMKILLRA